MANPFGIPHCAFPSTSLPSGAKLCACRPPAHAPLCSSCAAGSESQCACKKVGIVNVCTGCAGASCLTDPPWNDAPLMSCLLIYLVEMYAVCMLSLLAALSQCTIDAAMGQTQ